MLIPSRIKTIGNFILDTDSVADIGADHGLLELYLVAKYPNIKILAIENKVGPYKILDKNLRGFKNVRLSLSDGFDNIGKSLNTVVLAGMGGLNIKKILLKHPDKVKKVKKIIIDAHRDIKIARSTLVNFKFQLDKEVIVYEQEKFYVISKFIKSRKKVKYSDDELEIGYKLYEDKLWPKYRDYLILQNNKTIEKIKSNEKLQDRVLKLKQFNERLLNYGKN